MDDANKAGKPAEGSGSEGKEATQVHSKTPENAEGKLNPSAPEDANVTPGSTGDK